MIKECELRMFELKGNKEAKIKLIEQHFRDLTALEREIIMDEDFLCIAYDDGYGNWTLGVGHTRNTKKGDKCSIAAGLAWLEEDIETAISDCELLIYNFENIEPNKKNALVSWSFNLGYMRMKNFKKTIMHLNNLKWAKAAVEMLDSRWYRQVGKRAIRIAKALVE